MSDTSIIPASLSCLPSLPVISPRPVLNITAAQNTQLSLSLTPEPSIPAATRPSTTSILRAWRNKKWHQPASESHEARTKSPSATGGLPDSRLPAAKLPARPERPKVCKLISKTHSVISLAAITEWTITRWAQAKGETPAAKIIDLLCRDDRPKGLTGELLAELLTSLADGPKMSQRGIANLFYLSNSKARPEALALVINRWDQAEGKTASNKLTFLLQQHDFLENVTAHEFFIAQQFLLDVPNLALKTIANRFSAARSTEVQPPPSACDDKEGHPSSPPSPSHSLTDLSELAAMPSPYQQHYASLSRQPSPVFCVPADAELSLPCSPAYSESDGDRLEGSGSGSPSRSLLDFCEHMYTLSPLSTVTDGDAPMNMSSPFSTVTDDDEPMYMSSLSSAGSEDDELIPDVLPQLSAEDVNEMFAPLPPAHREY